MFSYPKTWGFFYEKARSILDRIPPEVLRYYTASARPEPGRTGPHRARKGDALE